MPGTSPEVSNRKGKDLDNLRAVIEEGTCKRLLRSALVSL